MSEGGEIELECTNCHSELNQTTITYTTHKYAGDKDGQHWEFTKVMPQCGVCGEITVKFDKNYAKKKE